MTKDGMTNNNDMESLQIEASSTPDSFEECDINSDENGDTTWKNEAMNWRGSPRYSDSPGAADQLPSVEEIKANTALGGGTGSTRRCSRWRWSSKFSIVFLVIALLVVWRIVTKEKQRRQQKREDGIDLLLLHRISSQKAFEDPKSPQSRALQWILFHDSLDPLFGQSTAPFIQRYIVAVFGVAVVPGYLRPTFHFLSGRHECDWNAESKKTMNDEETDSVLMGIICDDDKNVVQIVLKNVGLSGELPPELALLPHMLSLSLDINALVGTLPPLPNVQQELSLSYNQLGGNLNGANFSESLQELVLSENLFQGSIPTSLKLMTSLTRLSLDGNELTGGIANVFGLYNLKELNLQYNGLSDELSNGSFQELVNLRVLNVHTNRLSGPLPDALWTLSGLQVADFHSNALDGHIRKIQDGLALKHLNVGSNFLGGGLPEEINLLTELTHLDVSSNRFEIELPNLGSLSNMETLLLNNNALFGPQPLPNWLTDMTRLRRLSLRSTDRTGTIPTWVSNLTSLEVLDLDWNRLSGTIPTKLFELSNLEYLMLNRNWLEGTVPDDVRNMSSLKMLFVDNNRLVGHLDACHINFLIADCGDPAQGCPHCPSSLTQEVDCPCCTRCCFDGDSFCNADDWVSLILAKDGETNDEDLR